MHEEDYDDYDDYEDDHHNPEDAYKSYFKFDPDAWDAWGKALYDALDDVLDDFVDKSSNTWYVYGWNSKNFPVNSSFSNTGKEKFFQYLGNNYDGVQIWKKKYFAHNPIQHMYINHLSSHANYFVKQPHYYKGMFDILN